MPIYDVACLSQEEFKRACNIFDDRGIYFSSLTQINQLDEIPDLKYQRFDMYAADYGELIKISKTIHGENTYNVVHIKQWLKGE